MLSLLWEVFLQLIGEALIELGFRSAAEPFRRRERNHPVWAAVGVALIGSAMGLITVMALPHRILGVKGVRGLSLVLAPLGNAIAMEAYGRFREEMGGRRSYFATYWAGAIFAFSMALTRFMLIHP